MELMTRRSDGENARKTRFSKMLSVRLTPKQERWLETLTERYQCDNVEIIRRAFTAFARSEGLDGEEQ